MTNLNSVILQGRLVKDAMEEMRRSESGTCFGSFSLAVSKSTKDGDGWVDKTSFIKCKGFGKSYESAAKHMTKGSMCTVEGSLEQQSWEKDGQKRSELVVIVNKFYPTYKDGGNGKAAQQKETSVQQNEGGFSEDLPF